MRHADHRIRSRGRPRDRESRHDRSDLRRRGRDDEGGRRDTEARPPRMSLGLRGSLQRRRDSRRVRAPVPKSNHRAGGWAGFAKSGVRSRVSARRKVIIVAPHFPPSNLASVHRSRLLAQHLPKFGWDPIIVTVDHRYYEEQLDWGLAALLPEWLQIERVAALPTKPVRLVGDIGVRGWFHMLIRILHILDTQQVDFLYVTIPSNYAALLGRTVHALRGLPYGIDYIDPWVERAPSRARAFSKAWLTQKLAKFLEPVSVRRAALISGVAERYYEDVLARNPHLRRQSVAVAMPYGGEPADRR